MSPLAHTLGGDVSPAKTKTNPRGLGRRPNSTEPASKNLTIRLTPTQHEAYKAAADRARVSLGDWIREQCDRGLPRKRR